MTSKIQPTLIADDMHSPIRALHSLRDQQVAGITAGLMSLRSEWSIERHESCDGHLSLVLVHPARNTTILIDRDPSGILVSVMQGDELQTTPCRCSSDADAIDAVKAVAGGIGLTYTRHTA